MLCIFVRKKISILTEATGSHVNLISKPITLTFFVHANYIGRDVQP